jgi:simple sugar transport system permease protein
VSTALLLGLLLGAALMALWGYNPWTAYQALFHGAFGDRYALANTLSRATPLILTGLTFAIGVRAGLFNIGAQGQMLLGALAAVVVGGLWDLPPGWHLLAALLAATLAGALWSLPAAILKLTSGVHEVISTIMLNWIAFWFAQFAVLNYLSEGRRSIQAAPDARLPTFFLGIDIGTALLVSIAFAVFIYWVLWHMVSGYELRAAGLSPDAARYGGIRPERSLMWAFVLGGLAAGLAGAVEVLGRFPYAVTNDLSNLGTLGFDGIAVALVGRNHPVGAIASAIFFGALAAGSGMMSFRGVPIDMIQVVQGIIVLTIAVPELWRLGSGLFVRSRRRGQA